MKDIHLFVHEFNVYCYESGKNTNPTIVCLHGLGNSGAAFWELAEYLGI